MEFMNQNHNTFFESSTENVEKSENNSLMTSENIDFQRANDLSALLKHWFDSDENEGVNRPLSTITATGKNTTGMQNRCSRQKSIAEECDRCGGEKGEDYGKGDFFNVCKDHVSIGGRRKKPLQDLHKAMKTKNGNHRGNKRLRKS